jgi:hypothetical protein
VGWKTIKGRSHYYHMINDHGQIKSVYIKNQDVDAIDGAIQERKQGRLARIALRKRLDKAEQPIIALSDAALIIYIKYKYLTGYHLHKRQWRKQRARHMLSPDEIGMQLDRERARREFESGDEDALIRKYGAEPAHVALECLLASMSTNEYHKEACRHQFSRLKRKLLARRDPSTIESLMASRVALDWIDVHYADAWFYMSTTDLDIKAVDLLDRRRTRAARRLTRSVKCLADLQRTTVESVSRRMPRFEFEASIN